MRAVTVPAEAAATRSRRRRSPKSWRRSSRRAFSCGPSRATSSSTARSPGCRLRRATAGVASSLSRRGRSRNARRACSRAQRSYAITSTSAPRRRSSGCSRRSRPSVGTTTHARGSPRAARQRCATRVKPHRRLAVAGLAQHEQRPARRARDGVALRRVELDVDEGRRAPAPGRRARGEEERHQVPLDTSARADRSSPRRPESVILNGVRRSLRSRRNPGRGRRAPGRPSRPAPRAGSTSRCPPGRARRGEAMSADVRKVMPRAFVAGS